MLGKVDELAVNADTFYTFNLGETIKVVDDPLMVSTVLLKKIEEKRKLEVMVKFWKKDAIRIRVYAG
jgi:hypothetical protein